jgi:hypothetical protein
MVRQKVKSSNIESVGYDASASVLEIEFKTGSIYQYHAVPTLIRDQFLAAKSLGAFFNDKIRKVFRATSIK